MYTLRWHFVNNNLGSFREKGNRAMPDASHRSGWKPRTPAPPADSCSVQRGVRSAASKHHPSAFMAIIQRIREVEVRKPLRSDANDKAIFVDAATASSVFSDVTKVFP
jgi:hypothetical protein